MVLVIDEVVECYINTCLEQSTSKQVDQYLVTISLYGWSKVLGETHDCIDDILTQAQEHCVKLLSVNSLRHNFVGIWIVSY